MRSCPSSAPSRFCWSWAGRNAVNHISRHTCIFDEQKLMHFRSLRTSSCEMWKKSCIWDEWTFTRWIHGVSNCFSRLCDTTPSLKMSGQMLLWSTFRCWLGQVPSAEEIFEKHQYAWSPEGQVRWSTARCSARSTEWCDSAAHKFKPGAVCPLGKAPHARERAEQFTHIVMCVKRPSHTLAQLFASDSPQRRPPHAVHTKFSLSSSPSSTSISVSDQAHTCQPHQKSGKTRSSFCYRRQKIASYPNKACKSRYQSDLHIACSGEFRHANTRLSTSAL